MISWNSLFRVLIINMGIWLLFVSCDINSTDDDENGDLPSDVSYASDIQPIFNQSCAGSNCHIGESTNGVRLDSYEHTINSMGLRYEELIVQSGSPDESPLVDKIEPGPEEGSRMPLNQNPLDEEEIKLIKGWIKEGAKDN